jgi:hypothetical protein
MEFLKDFLVANGLALLVLFLGWVYGRVLSGGGPLSAVKRRILFYGFVFALGMMHLMLMVSDLCWPKDILFPLIGVWGGVVGLVAWLRCRRRQRIVDSQNQI